MEGLTEKQGKTQNHGLNRRNDILLWKFPFLGRDGLRQLKVNSFGWFWYMSVGFGFMFQDCEHGSYEINNSIMRLSMGGSTSYLSRVESLRRFGLGLI